MMQEAAGVNDQLIEKLPEFYYNEQLSYLNIREKLRIDVMTRMRYRWNIECERNDRTTSKKFAESLYGIRNYFYGHEEAQ